MNAYDRHIVDAHRAQELSADSPHIGAVFALVGLFLCGDSGLVCVCVERLSRESRNDRPAAAGVRHHVTGG
jgi:hypothetical protein